MSDSSAVPMRLMLENSELDPDQLEEITQNLSDQMELVERVQRVPVLEKQGDQLVPKGDQKEPGILNIEINLENLTAFVKWLYQKVTGKPIKVKMKFEELEFEFEGNARDLGSMIEQSREFGQAIVKKLEDDRKPAS